MLREKHGIIRDDYILLAVVLLLTMLGLVILYSASYLFAMNQPWRFSNARAPLTGNFAACLIMVVLFPVLMILIKIEWLNNGKVIFGIITVTAILNMLPFFPYFQRALHDPGTDVMRWIVLKVGDKELVTFQPSELIKITLPLYLAYILDKNSERLDSFVYGPLPPVVVTAGFCTIVLLQSNFSDAVLIAFISLVICFAAGIRLRWFVLTIALVIPAAFMLINSNARWSQRIDNFINKAEIVSSGRTQIDFSLEAVKSGGFWGKGFGHGTLKTRMPEVHGDFVFASFAEESGFLGVLGYLFLIGFFGFLGYVTAWRSKDRFAQLLAFGLVTPIIVQTLLNIAVVAGIIPVTGVPLPFVSSGGSSMLITLISAALIVNITRRNAILDDMGVHRVR